MIPAISAWSISFLKMSLNTYAIWFPEIVSYNRFVELEKEVAILLSRTGGVFYLVKAYFYKVKAMLWGRKSYALTR